MDKVKQQQRRAEEQERRELEAAKHGSNQPGLRVSDKENHQVFL